MPVTMSATLSISATDGIQGNSSLTKLVTGLAFSNASEFVYNVNQTVNTSAVSLTLPIIPVPFLYIRNTATNGSGQILTVNATPAILLNPPASPSLSQSSGGTINATTYYVKTTYINQFGETTASVEASFAVATNNLLVVTAPIASGSGAGVATSYNVYVSNSSGTETKQTVSPIALGSNWTEPVSALIAGTALPTGNTAGGSQGTSVITREMLPGSVWLAVDNASGAGIYAVSVTGNQPNVPFEYIVGA